jgi:hypothetical protein
VSNWILTKGLQNLRAQVDAAFPDRSHASDGTIGDTAHQAETSGHNPDDTPGSRPEWNGDPDGIPEVRAWDCTSDFGPGVDAQAVVDHIRALPGVASVIRYMIYNRREYHERNGFAPTAYTGASAHTEHIHFSGAFSQAADNNTSFDYRLEEIPVALTADDKKWISQQISAPYVDTDSTGLVGTLVGHQVLCQQIPNGTKPGTPQDTTYAVIRDMGLMLVDLQKQVVELVAKLPAPKA